jgi:RimJ/RimL family protein N-acetyltransferase
VQLETERLLEELRRRVIALIDPENERSIAVAERLGLSHKRDVLQNSSKTMRPHTLAYG